MCEFKVFLDDEKVMEDVLFAQANERGVKLSDIMGESKEIEGVAIAEVNVMTTKLILKRV
jgi:predicted RNA-binding protein